MALDGEGGAPSNDSGLTYVDFCLTQATFWCGRAAECCADSGVAVDFAPCYAERAAACHAADEPSTYDPLAAGECLRDTYAAWGACSLREDEPAALAAAASCARVTREELPKLGEPCTGKCRQEPDLTVFCDTRSDGAGSFRCERGGKPVALDGYCGETNRCDEPGRCIDAHCSLPLEDGAVCSGRGQCASGYCCASVFCSEGSFCRPKGTPLVQPEECERLATLANAVVTWTASGTRNFVAVAGSDLWWNEGIAVWRSELDGSSARPLIALDPPQYHPRYYPLGLLFDAGDIYYLESDRIGTFERGEPHDGSSWTIDIAAAASAPSTSFAATDDAVYIASVGCRYITRMSKDTWDSEAGRWEMRVSAFEGGDSGDNAGYVAVSSDRVYCVSDASIYSMPLTGGPLERIATLDAWGGPSLFYDGTLYFTNIDHQKPPQGTPALRAFRVSDGSIETLAVLSGMSLGLLLDEASGTLYFANGDSIGSYGLQLGSGFEYRGPELVRSLAQSATDLYYLTDSGIFRVPKPRL